MRLLCELKTGKSKILVTYPLINRDMYKKLPCYTIICDSCWTNWLEWCDYFWFESKKQCLDEVLDMDWKEKWDKVYCHDCRKYDDDSDNIIIKDKFRIFHWDWEREWTDYAPRTFSTLQDAEKYIEWYEWENWSQMLASWKLRIYPSF